LSLILTAQALDARRFDHARLDELFDLILIDDDVDPETPLPAQVPLDWDQEALVDGYRLSRQLWIEGTDHGKLIELVRKLRRDRDLNDEDRLAYKYARAMYKHVRFAHALADARHRYPIILNWTTVALGHLQDAFKNKHRASVWRQAQLNLFLLSGGPQDLVHNEIDRLRADTPAGFRTYTLRQMDGLRAALARDTMTGKVFHHTRKIASRQVAFLNNMLALRHDEDLYRTARCWAAINGLMGSMHDVLIERRVAGTQDYHREQFALPDDIAGRLRAILALYPKP
jgi:hypothetical protein